METENLEVEAGFYSNLSEVIWVKFFYQVFAVVVGLWFLSV